MRMQWLALVAAVLATVCSAQSDGARRGDRDGRPRSEAREQRLERLRERLTERQQQRRSNQDVKRAHGERSNRAKKRFAKRRIVRGRAQMKNFLQRNGTHRARQMRWRRALRLRALQRGIATRPDRAGSFERRSRGRFRQNFDRRR